MQDDMSGLIHWAVPRHSSQVSKGQQYCKAGLWKREQDMMYA